MMAIVKDQSVAQYCAPPLILFYKIFKPFIWVLNTSSNIMLRAIGMRERFEVIVIGDECSRGKPDPEPYLEAMRQLDVRPQDCIAFEDSQSGMRAAARSGAFAIGVCSGVVPDRLHEAGARATITDFTDPALPGLLDRLREPGA